MKKIILATVAIATLLGARENSFIARTELGYIRTDGNTNTEAFNFDSKLKRRWEWHSLDFQADAQIANSNNSRTASRMETELGYSYEYSDVFSYGYLGGYKKDKFSGYDYQFYTGPDIKYKAIHSDKENLSLELALLYAEEKIENREGQAYASYRIRGVYDNKFIDNVKFQEDFSYRGSFEDVNNFFIVSKTSLINRVTDRISAGLTYRIDHSNIVPNGREKTDATFMVNLILNYN